MKLVRFARSAKVYDGAHPSKYVARALVERTVQQGLLRSDELPEDPGTRREVLALIRDFVRRLHQRPPTFWVPLHPDGGSCQFWSTVRAAGMLTTLVEQLSSPG